MSFSLWKSIFSCGCQSFNTTFVTSVQRTWLAPYILRTSVISSVRQIHIQHSLHKKAEPGPQKWQLFNQVMWPPQAPGEPRRPAEVFHFKRQIKYSPRKMWYLADMVKNMSIDEAIKQLSFRGQKGAHIMKTILEEAQKLAVEKHHVEYKSNLYIEDSFVCKGRMLKGMRRHAKGQMGLIHYRYCHYFVRLREGRPPPPPPEVTGQTLLENYIEKHRQKYIRYFL